MTVIRRCLFKDPDESLPSILMYERTLSVTVYRTSFTFYSCMGSSHHPPHLIRLEYGQIVRSDSSKPKIVAKQTNPIPLKKRKRLFPREVMFCPIGKCKLKVQKVLTQELEDHETQEIFRCPGSVKANHHGHFLKVCHGFLDGMLGDTENGILIITIEK